MSTKSIQIQPNPHPTPTQPAVFAPAAVVANAGDNLTWYNADQRDHWPAAAKLIDEHIEGNRSSAAQHRQQPGDPRQKAAWLRRSGAAADCTSAAGIPLNLVQTWLGHAQLTSALLRSTSMPWARRSRALPRGCAEASTAHFRWALSRRT